jgi:hypothetical protein
MAFSLLYFFDLPVRLTPAMKASRSAIEKERRQESLFSGAPMTWSCKECASYLGVRDCARVNESPLAHDFVGPRFLDANIFFPVSAEEQRETHTIEDRCFNFEEKQRT